MGNLTQEIFASIFGALLLICLCHSTSLTGSGTNLGQNSSYNFPNGSDPTTNLKNMKRGERCFGTLKRWMGFSGDSDVLSSDPNDVHFFSYPNPSDKNYIEELKFGDVESLRRNRIRSGIPLKIVIHGFERKYTHESIQMIKDAYLARTFENPRFAVNVVLVDWEALGNPKVESGGGLYYSQAAANTAVVGKRVGEFIQFLINNRVVLSLDDVHIIGFSLGAHVAGNAGNTLKELNDGKLAARITGLDPAGPRFRNLVFSNRALSKTDARFLDVYHTNMGRLGTSSNLGHVDFYPNGGGPNQNRCEVEYDQKKAAQGENTSGGGIWDTRILTITSCSHNKAPEFFAMSILNSHMVGCQCESYQEYKSGNCPCQVHAVFGEYTPPGTVGVYYLDI